MAASVKSGSATLDTINNLFGTALEFPECFRKPGSASLFSSVHGTAPDGGLMPASLSTNPSLLNPISFHATGIQDSLGKWAHAGAMTVTGEMIVLGTELRTAVTTNSLKGTSNSLNAAKDNTIVAGGKNVITAADGITLATGGTLILTGSTITIGGLEWKAKTTFWDSKKPFDILHPTKEGHRLRYVCLEGPAAEVYVRGTLKNSNIIELPEYWKGLVDEETIGVTLTPIGTYQELFWEKVEWGTKIVVKNNAGASINCHYVIFGERKDTSKNITEYQGLTPMDYPGDNREYNLIR